jgi:hypothetical protein
MVKSAFGQQHMLPCKQALGLKNLPASDHLKDSKGSPASRSMHAAGNCSHAGGLSEVMLAQS